MAKTKFTGISECYIFDEAGGKRDQLEQAILQEFQAKKYPLQATITTIKASGGGLLGALGATKHYSRLLSVCGSLSDGPGETQHFCWLGRNDGQCLQTAEAQCVLCSC